MSSLVYDDVILPDWQEFPDTLGEMPNIGVSDLDPSILPEDLQPQNVNTQSQQVPAKGLDFDWGVLNVQTREEFDALSPGQQEVLKMMKRGVVFNGNDAAQFILNFENPERKANSQKAQTEAAIADKELAAKERESAMNVRRQISSIRTMQNVVDQLETHPGLSGAVGMKGIGNYLPGTKEADFKALLDQVAGGVFLQAYNDLKGGGPITDVEGKKAEQALARFNANQTEQGFKNALKEFRGFLRDAEDRILNPQGGEQADNTQRNPETPETNVMAAQQQQSQPAQSAQPAQQLPPERVVGGRKFRLNERGRYVPVN